ncbi:MAG: UMP kinase [Candidatus Cloacimonadaceae bacterium]
MDVYQPEKIHRIMLKLSGEILAGELGHGFDDEVIDRLTDDIIDLRKMGYSIAVVLGGGNFFRGGNWKNQSLNRVVLDSIGMLGTVQNALYLTEILNQKKYPAEVFSALNMDKIAKYYTPQRAKKALEKGNICFLCGGTGNPFFTTDTAAVLRAAEMELDIVFKGTKVDGLYSDDPKINPQAEFISNATFKECLERNLGVMDMTAFSLAQEYSMPLKIFNVTRRGSIIEAALRADFGTFIHP